MLKQKDYAESKTYLLRLSELSYWKWLGKRNVSHGIMCIVVTGDTPQFIQ